MTDTSPEKIETICSNCEKVWEVKPKKTGEARVPRGWKKLANKLYCDKCKYKLYVLRAVSIPVAKTDWKALKPMLWPARALVTKAANWAVSEYYVRDVALRGPRTEKIPKWEMPNLYQDMRTIFPDIEATTVVSLLNTVGAKYRAARFDLWRGAVSVPTFRELPLPINGQNWTLSKVENSYVFSFRYSREHYELTLRSDHAFARQHRALAQIVNGETESGAALLYEAGRYPQSKLMLKLPAWFLRKEVPNAERVIDARTVADGFLEARSGTGSVWRLNADHVRRWIVGAARTQQRLREDLKAERRFPKPIRAQIVEKMGFVSDKRASRIDSWIHEASMQLVNWAVRQRAKQLIWDDSYRSGMPEQFPWFIFSERLNQKCDLAGIEFIKAAAAPDVDRAGEEVEVG